MDHGQFGKRRESGKTVPHGAAERGQDPRGDRAADATGTSARQPFRLPFVPVRFGLDTIVGLIPGVGDTATALPALYLIYRGYKLGVPRRTLVTMAANVGLDVSIGSIPVIGDAFDLFFKANRRNAHHLQRHLDRLPPEASGVDAAA